MHFRLLTCFHCLTGTGSQPRHYHTMRSRYKSPDLHVASVPLSEDKASKTTTPNNPPQDNQPLATAKNGTMSHRVNPLPPQLEGVALNEPSCQ